MLAEPVSSALVIGKLRGGKLNNLLRLKINWMVLIIIAALVQSLGAIIVAKELTPYWKLINDYGIWLQLVVYILLFCAVIKNYHLKGMSFILIGILLNFIVIMSNGGRMPVDIKGIEHMLSAESLNILQNAKSLTHVAASESTKFLILGDIIHLKRPYPLPKSLSIGDIFKMIGIFKLIYKGLFNEKYKKRIKLFKYNLH
ncbi:DUF5317 domain-containing protein [Serpentinicella alkaliphila]|uniref:Uncharacterized protein n=1 Tax=Serpentinicella alkaliphila TaxID=1734049 RepID=A0A4R2TJ77_9FIRM|nr:DUF5317 domain-containing protein [Serpentinicella alkaliphila]QUH24701.1 DUF5317 domain-containing protein [Serpentinicella alkaliphila]TCQ03690.1 hypothetical protein EDD79_10085 [Serpentinicella alkaliphila]